MLPSANANGTLCDAVDSLVFYILHLLPCVGSPSEGVDAVTKWLRRNGDTRRRIDLGPFKPSLLIVGSCESKAKTREENKAENFFCGHASYLLLGSAWIGLDVFLAALNTLKPKVNNQWQLDSGGGRDFPCAQKSST